MKRLIALLLFPIGLMAQTYQDYYAHFNLEEGFRNTAYIDTRGNATVGIGHLIKNHERLSGPLSDKQIETLFIHDLGVAIVLAKNSIPSFDLQPPEVRLILVSMAFNLGNKGLGNFKKFRQCIEEMNYKKAAIELHNSLYFKQLPKRVNRYIETLKRA